MDPESVINLGHPKNIALMYPGSELVDGFEPHGLICPCPMTACSRRVMTVGRRCTRGGVAGWVPGWAIPGTTQPDQIEAYFHESED